MDESVREDLVDQERREFLAAVFGNGQQRATDDEKAPEQESPTPEEEHSALVAHLFGGASGRGPAA
jgi:hypothetical protein